MRVFAPALIAALLLVPSASATPHGPELLVRNGHTVELVGDNVLMPALLVGPYRPLGLSGDGRLVSIGGTILGHARLPTRDLAWAPTGERAAYATTEGAVVTWTPAGRRTIEPKGWGATSWSGRIGLAWSRDGALAIARGADVWVWRNGVTREVAGPAPLDPGTGGPSLALPFAWHGDAVLWWAWPGSGSVASDGVALFEGNRLVGKTLMYPDYVATCGAHLAVAVGANRDSTTGKRIVFDGRDVSHDPRYSWTSPSCTAGGRLVATATRDGYTRNLSETHRAIWQLLPTRRQLTRPPWGWSDESPRFLQDGDLLFVRSRIHSVRNGDTWRDTAKGRVMVLSQGKLRQMAELGYVQNEDEDLYLGPYYGHYDWSTFLAVHA